MSKIFECLASKAHMPQPHGTFLRTQSKDKIVHGAREDKKKVATADDTRRAAFYKALDRHSEREITDWLNRFRKLSERVKKKQRDAATDSDDDLKVEVKVVKQLKEILSEVRDSTEFMAMVGGDARIVIRATPPKVGAGWDLAVVIAIVSVLEVLLRLRKSK